MRANSPTLLFLLLACLVCSGCHTKLFHHTDEEHSITISYPGNVDLFTDKEKLQAQAGSESSAENPVDKPELLFVLTTIKQSQITAAVHSLPPALKLTPEEYYQESTARELEALQVNIVEPKSDLTIDERGFQRVGFTLMAGEQEVRSRIYQHLDTASGRIVVLTVTSLAAEWDDELPTFETIVNSLKVDW